MFVSWSSPTDFTNYTVTAFSQTGRKLMQIGERFLHSCLQLFLAQITLWNVTRSVQTKAEIFFWLLGIVVLKNETPSMISTCCCWLGTPGVNGTGLNPLQFGKIRFDLCLTFDVYLCVFVDLEYWATVRNVVVSSHSQDHVADAAIVPGMMNPVPPPPPPSPHPPPMPPAHGNALL